MDLQTSYGTAKGRESYSVRCLRVKAAYGDAAFELFRDGMSCEKIAKYINEPVDMVKQLEKSGRVSMIRKLLAFKFLLLPVHWSCFFTASFGFNREYTIILQNYSPVIITIFTA